MSNLLSSHAGLDQPSAWVVRFAPLIPLGEVLDLACGAGRHARLLSALGHAVVAVDRDAGVLERTAGSGIATQQIDLEASDAAWPYEAGRFAGIVVTNYLHRPLFSSIVGSLAAGGILIYETFAQGNEQFGKPSNPAFLLKSGELLEVLCATQDPVMHILAFEDGYVEMPKPAMVQRVCAVKSKESVEQLRLRLT